jgi:hypothetical protein
MQATLKATVSKRAHGFVATLINTDTTEALTGKPCKVVSRFHSKCVFVHREHAQERADNARREAMTGGYIPAF